MQTKIINGLLLVVLLLAGYMIYKNKFQSTPTVDPGTIIPTATASQLPKIPNQEGKFLMENVSYIDVTFNNLPFSMSIDNAPGIRSNLGLIDAAGPAPELKSICQPIGTIFYDVNAQTYMSADIMYGEGCNYFVFKKNNQPLYANRMTPDAVQYFTNVMTQVKVK